MLWYSYRWRTSTRRRGTRKTLSHRDDCWRDTKECWDTGGCSTSANDVVSKFNTFNACQKHFVLGIGHACLSDVFFNFQNFILSILWWCLPHFSSLWSSRWHIQPSWQQLSSQISAHDSPPTQMQAWNDLILYQSLHFALSLCQCTLVPWRCYVQCRGMFVHIRLCR